MSKALYQESIVEKGSAEKKAWLSQWFNHYCEISITWITLFNAESRLSRRHALVKQGCKSAGGAFVVRCKRIANAFVLISSLTPAMDLAHSSSARDWRGALAFRPDSLAVVSLSRDQLSARTDYTWDTDAFSRECFDSWPPPKKSDLSWKHQCTTEEQS